MAINDLTNAPVEETPRAVPTPKPIINDIILVMVPKICKYNNKKRCVLIVLRIHSYPS